MKSRLTGVQTDQLRDTSLFRRETIRHRLQVNENGNEGIMNEQNLPNDADRQNVGLLHNIEC